MSRPSRSRFDSMDSASRIKMREQAVTIAQMDGYAKGPRGAKADPGQRPKTQKGDHKPGNTAGAHNVTRSLVQQPPKRLTDIKAGLTARRTPSSREGGENPAVNTGGGKDALQRVAAKRVKLHSAKGTGRPGRKLFGGHGGR